MKYILLIVALTFAAACGHQAPVPPPPTETCQDWCSHAADLGCEAAKPTARGASCVEVCANMLTGPAAFDLQCRTHAASCTAADDCETGVVSTATSSTCAAWCKHAATLRCDAARPTPAGASCEEVCRNAQEGPRLARFNLYCRVHAASCVAADACERRQ